MSLTRYIAFKSAAFKIAWWRIKSWFSQRAFDIALLVVTVIFAIVFFLLGDRDFQDALLGMLPTLVIVIGVVLYELATAGYHQWIEQQGKIDSLTTAIKSYEDKSKFALELTFEDRAPFVTSEHISILPKVISGRMVKNCRGYIKKLE